MDNYIIAESKDQKIECPFPAELTANIPQFSIGKNTKFGGIIAKLLKDFESKTVERVILFGVGNCCAKCISCVEVLKSRLKQSQIPVFQWNVLKCVKSTDTWAPDLSADQRLNSLTVEKFIPQIFIMVSYIPFPESYKCNKQQSTENTASPLFKNSETRKRPIQKLKQTESFNVNPNSGGSSDQNLKRVNKWKRQPKNSKKKEGQKQSSNAKELES